MTTLTMLLTSCLVAGFAGPAAVGPDARPQAELEALGGLIVGTWEGSGSRHVHEWGVGRQLIRSRSYVSGEATDEWVLVSEGIWYQDEERGAVRGLVFAEGMPMHRMEYRSRVDGNEVVHDLRTYGDQPGRFVETWTFGSGRYEWRLERPTEEGPEVLMSGSYRRVEPEGRP